MTLYLILVATSRSRQRRSYRVFSVESGKLADVTATTCRTAGIHWNDVLGTWDAYERLPELDAAKLERMTGNVYHVEVL